MADDSPIIVSLNGAKSKELSIEAALPQSSMGVVTLPPVRTYPFDIAFGPEADQALICSDARRGRPGLQLHAICVRPHRDGQDLHDAGRPRPNAPLGNPSANAGMIPRVHLFHHLESSASDFSVKISYVELYNEELRDLLATELSAPTGSTQMGKGTRGPEGLKIFDDASKHGVLIQGLEEITVKNSADALGLLTKGSERRQIATTKRRADDLLKVGKLNLVDLAGSENIGRSGAENKRAREAGMINQSLLTLRRVINALVDKAQHVPYRESKLTRLLQDSLGGRTKTCIIATVSPARSNMEKTLSTLDYAMRAKSIRNKPELNQRTTRNSLLKEYVVEIERLKADVLAAREKNGIFFSEETWLQLRAEQEMRQTELEEAKKQVDIVEEQMRIVRDEFEQGISLLKKREGELKDTRDQLKETEEVLDSKQVELKLVQGVLEEETVIRQAHQETEGRLNGVALGLKVVVRDSVKDVGGLFDKLERKSSILNANAQAVLTHGKATSSSAIVLSRKLEEFHKSSSQSTTKLCTEAKQFEAKELEALAGHSERIDQELKRIQAALAVVHAKDTAEAEALALVQNAVKETHETFRVGFAAWATTLKTSCETTCSQANDAGLEAFTTGEKAVKAMGSVVENVHILEDQKLRGPKAKDELLQRVSGLLGEFTKERDRGLQEAVGVVQAANRKAEEGMEVFERKHGEIAGVMEAKGEEVARGVEKWGGDAKRTRDGALICILYLARDAGADVPLVTEYMVLGSIDSYSTEVQAQMQNMNATCSTAFDRQTSSKRARIETTTSLGAEVQSEYMSLQRGFASTYRNIEGAVARVVSEVRSFDVITQSHAHEILQSTGLSSATDTYHDISRGELSSATNATKDLAEHGAKADTSTGSTPRKRVRQYVAQWELTKSRAELLQSWRETGVSSAGSETFLAEHRPLPEIDAEEDDVDAMLVDEDVMSPLSESCSSSESPVN
ncbi:hypothetical protein B0H13DRAFT_1853106 [Mycena leptocephala]|nr:hypothetical protein B0H13DRAFT_1853106 [Mycena leptocephala]